MTDLTPETKARLVAMAESNIRHAWTSLATSPEIRRQLELTPLRSHVPVLNLQEFVLLSQADISALLHDMATHLPGGRGMLYSRVALLTCYESLRTLKGLLDHRFRGLMVTLLSGQHAPEETDVLLKNAHSSATRLFHAMEREFKDVRDGIIAHRDPDPNTRIALHNKADPQRVADVVIEVLALLNQLYEVLVRHQRVLIGELQQLVRQRTSGPQPG